MDHYHFHIHVHDDDYHSLSDLGGIFAFVDFLGCVICLAIVFAFLFFYIDIVF